MRHVVATFNQESLIGGISLKRPDRVVLPLFWVCGGHALDDLERVHADSVFEKRRES